MKKPHYRYTVYAPDSEVGIKVIFETSSKSLAIAVANNNKNSFVYDQFDFDQITEVAQ